MMEHQLQAMVCNILLPTPAITDYTIGLEIWQLTGSFSLVLKWH